MPADDALSVAEVLRVLTLQGGRNTTLVIAGSALFGLASGLVGVFAVLRGRALVADAVSHAALPGIAGAFLLATVLGFEGRSMPVLLIGAALTGLLSVAVIQAIVRHSRLREDAAIASVLSVFFGAGIVLLSVIQTAAPKGSAGLDGLIYGEVATMLPRDVVMLGAVALGVAACTLILFKEFAVVSFNDAFARVSGWPVGAIDTVLTGLLVVVIATGLPSVGVIMVVSMLVIPPVAARLWSDRLRTVAVLSAAIGAGSAYVGASVSAVFAGLPAGALIVLASGAAFLVSLLFAPKRGAFASFWRLVRTRVRIASDHLLEAAVLFGDGPVPRTAIDQTARTRGWSLVFRRVVVAGLRLGGQISPHADGSFALTPAGRARGARVARNHAIWEQYLTSHADIAPSHVDWSVDQVEHVLPPELIDRLERELAEGQVANADRVGDA